MRSSVRDLYIWIYQKSEAPVPWAARVHGMNRRGKISFDCEIFAEWIPNGAQRLAFHDCNFHILRMPKGADAPASTCVVSDLTGLLIDLCTLYGGDIADEDLKSIRSQMQKLYLKIR